MPYFRTHQQQQPQQQATTPEQIAPPSPTLAALTSPRVTQTSHSHTRVPLHFHSSHSSSGHGSATAVTQPQKMTDAQCWEQWRITRRGGTPQSRAEIYALNQLLAKRDAKAYEAFRIARGGSPTPTTSEPLSVVAAAADHPQRSKTPPLPPPPPPPQPPQPQVRTSQPLSPNEEGYLVTLRERAQKMQKMADERLREASKVNESVITKKQREAADEYNAQRAQSSSGLLGAAPARVGSTPNIIGRTGLPSRPLTGVDPRAEYPFGGVGLAATQRHYRGFHAVREVNSDRGAMMAVVNGIF